MKSVIAIALAGVVGFIGLAATNFISGNEPVLRVVNWAEYIDGGDENSYLIEEFEEWYEEQTGKKIRVEYCIADDNEILYNMIKMGDHFDLICPSEYMLMKLADEGWLQTLPDSFYDTSVDTNYYAKYVSPFIYNTFSENYINGKPWKDYAAGYMWGTTGFIYNPEYVDEEDVKTWQVLTNPKYAQKITAKNNIRDSYFTGLAMHYENDILALNAQFERGEISKSAYKAQLSAWMNDSSEDTMNAVKKKLMSMTSNLYGFETDEGKNEVIAGNVTVNYQWSGDAACLIYEMEYDDEGNPLPNPTYLNYASPDAVSNLWFDGWALTKDCKDVEAATMFINFLSQPEVAVNNMNFIGYTSCMAGDAVFTDYVLDCYEADETEEDVILYDLNYYFNPTYVEGDESTRSEDYIFYTYEEETKRMLGAQYPTEDTLARCVAMQYFTADANNRANRMWSDITFF